MTRFSIIIVSWNARPLLEKFLPSVMKTAYPDFEVILADNHSSDDSVAWIQEHHPAVRVVSHDKNYGYAEGNNRAVNAATGDVLVFLNNDVEVSPSWLTELDSFLRAHPNYDIAQPKLRSFSQKSHFEYAGAAGGFIDVLGYPFCRGRLFDTVEEDLGQYDSVADIFWASGAAFVVKKEAFQQLKGFDAVFEFHLEEIDLCWRAWSSGMRIGYAPQSVVYHVGGGSLPVQSYRKVFYNFRNSLLMLYKNVGKRRLSTILKRLILDGIAGLRFLLQGQFSLILAVIHAHFSFYAILLWKKNNLIFPDLNEENPLPDGILFKKSIIWSYFVQRKTTFAQLWPEHK